MNLKQLSVAFLAMNLLVLHASVPALILSETPSEIEKTALEEMAEHIQLATGISPVIASEEEAPAGQKIYIGNTIAAQQKGIMTETMGQEAWRICAQDSNVLIIAGGFPRGIMYGVYEFLERNLGVLWLDEWSTHVPKTEKISWPATWDISGQPSFEMRGIWAYWAPPASLRERFMSRLRSIFYTFHLTEKSEAFRLGTRNTWGSPNFCHVYYHYTKDLPPEKDHILAWSELQQKRIKPVNAGGPGQVCYSNPETVDWFVQKLKIYIAEDRKSGTSTEWPKYYSMMKNDNHIECECAACKELLSKYRSQNGVQLSFTNKIAREIGKTYPDIILRHDVYGKNCMLPEGILPEKNVMLEVALGHGTPDRPRDCYKSWNDPYNEFTRSLMEKWFQMSSHRAIWDYWTDCYDKNYIPAENSQAIVENLKIYKKLGVQWCFAQCGAASTASFHALRFWLGLRFMNNVDLDINQETSRFMTAYFGKAAPMMSEFLDFQRRQQQKLEKSIHRYSALARHDLDDHFFNTSENLFRQAEEAEAGNPVILERIANERIPVDRARLERRSILTADPTLPIADILTRYEFNFSRKIKKYERKDFAGKELKKLEVFCNALKVDIPVLEGFNPEAVLADYSWPYLLGGDYQNPVVEDSDAAGGNALAPLYPKEVNTISFIVYDWGDQQYKARKCMIPQQALPQDEKFHWYSLGRLQIGANSQIILCSDWHMRKALDSAYTNPEEFNNIVTIYVSVKVQGPRYVEGSTKPNLYMVDRVVVCRADQDDLHPAGITELPAELKSKKVFAALSGTSLCLDKVYEPVSVLHCAVQINNDGITLNGTATQDNRAIGSDKIIADGKYHLYKIGPALLSNAAVLQIGSARIPLNHHWDALIPHQLYEIWLSIRKTDTNNGFLDSVFLVK